MTIKIDCEETVWYLLPLIRKEFAKSLIKDHGLTQRKAAEKLGITEAAVSQYVSKKTRKFESNRRRDTTRNQRINKTNYER